MNTERDFVPVKHKAIRILGVIAVYVSLVAGSYGQTTESGFYLGGGLGGVKYSGFNELCRAFTGALPGINVDVDCDTDETVGGGKIFLGWRFNPYFALEGGFSSLGEAEDQGLIFGQPVTGKVGVDVFFAELVGSVPVGKRVKLLGKLGIADLDANLSIQSDGPIAVPLGLNLNSKSSSEMIYGIGAEINFSPKVAGRLEWERIDFLDGVNMFMASIVFYPQAN